MLEKGPLNRLFPLANYINCDPLCDHSKSKAQTTKVQQPRPCLLIPFAKLNYFGGGGGGGHQFFFTTGWKKRFAQS